MPTRQLKVSVKAADSFRQNLRDGVFSIILEYNLPPVQQPLMMALETGLELMQFARKEKRICSVAVSEGFDIEESHELSECIGALRKHMRSKELIAAVSGRRLDLEKLSSLLTELAEQRVSTVTVHTGAALPDHPRDKNELPLTAPDLYLDSTRMLHYVRRKWPDVHIGARINPYKYVLPDSHLQYYKMMKKHATGAEFLVAQAGWDMKKLHELQWYQRRRDLDEPLIARLLLLRRSIVSKIMNHEYPGLVISRELGAQVQRAAAEGMDGVQQQIRRLAVQIAGCRLLGYSGVQLCGIDDPMTAGAVLDAAFEAFDEFAEFDAWVDGWQTVTRGVEMAPAGRRYYVFHHLLEPGCLEFDAAESPPNDEMLGEPAAGTRWRYNNAVRFGAAGSNGGLAQRMFCGYQPGRKWNLQKTMLQCAADCPKALEEGACGESRADGACEFGHKPCFYHEVLRLAQWQRQLDIFEEPCVRE